MASNNMHLSIDERRKSSSDIDPVDAALAQLEVAREGQFIDYAPQPSQLLGSFSVICLFLNRTIGAGIIISPGIVINGTRSLGASLCLWAIGAIVALCSLLVWMEFGLSIPVQPDPDTQHLRNIPRSGGEKNFLEYVFSKPRLLTVCTYGILYLLLGNLAGNAITVGIFTLRAASNRLPREEITAGDPAVVGIAIVAITLSVAMHVFSRRGGILINNAFACLKVIFLLIIIILGFVNYGRAKAAGGNDEKFLNNTLNYNLIQSNFNPSNVFRNQKEPGADGAGVINAFLYVTYAFSGVYQVFYVLSEVATPRATVPKATYFALAITTVLYILTNVSYFFVLDVNDYVRSSDETPNTEMAAQFFEKLFGQEVGRKVFSSMVVLTIFGNLLTMSFVASRVKQEIAKEGILPFSRWFAKGHQTPFSWLRSKYWPFSQRRSENTERAPLTGLLLHWISTMVCIIATSWMRPEDAFPLWVTLYGFSVRLLVPMVVSGSLIYLKFNKSTRWTQISAYNPGPIPAIICFVVTSATFWAGFAEPAVQFTVVGKHWILPLVALSSPLWGVLWWCGLRLLERIRHEEMMAVRTTFIDQRENGEYVQVAEIVNIEWRARLRNRHSGHYA